MIARGRLPYGEIACPVGNPLSGERIDCPVLESAVCWGNSLSGGGEIRLLVKKRLVWWRNQLLSGGGPHLLVKKVACRVGEPTVWWRNLPSKWRNCLCGGEIGCLVEKSTVSCGGQLSGGGIRCRAQGSIVWWRTPLSGGGSVFWWRTGLSGGEIGGLVGESTVWWGIGLLSKATNCLVEKSAF